MKWFVLFLLRGVSLGGPYDTQQECAAALDKAMAQPIIDQRFDGATAGGVCFQGIPPNLPPVRINQ